jgi:hypothetical protein
MLRTDWFSGFDSMLFSLPQKKNFLKFPALPKADTPTSLGAPWNHVRAGGLRLHVLIG